MYVITVNRYNRQHLRYTSSDRKKYTLSTLYEYFNSGKIGFNIFVDLKSEQIKY
jgi:hypothetical protein